ncbi:MAG: peptidoglycan-N-acetylglucosamine deacetylase, partial [Actinomycetota bacterium]|nr:peptidoglycan-N-acetylglucosamine deacetylase [Actinomycetota bacterium]
RADLARARDSVEDATGVTPSWFRPPYGNASLGSVSAARRLGLRLVLWTTWGWDWTKRSTTASVVRTVMDDLRPGATILLHDAGNRAAPECWKETLGALPLLSDSFEEYRYRVGPLRDHFTPSSP